MMITMTSFDPFMDLVYEVNYEMIMDEIRAEEELQYQEEDQEALDQYNTYWDRENYKEWLYWKRVELDAIAEEVEWLEDTYRSS